MDRSTLGKVANRRPSVGHFPLQLTSPVGYFLKSGEALLTASSQEGGPHLGGGGIAGEDGPGLPGHAVAVLLVHVLSQPVHVGAGQSEGQLQVLLGEQEGPDVRVQPGRWSKRESVTCGSLCFRPLPFENGGFRSYHPLSRF